MGERALGGEDTGGATGIAGVRPRREPGLGGGRHTGARLEPLWGDMGYKLQSGPGNTAHLCKALRGRRGQKDR